MYNNPTVTCEASNKLTIPSANEEKVVKPPQKPVEANLPNSAESVFLNKPAEINPIKKHPLTLTTKIAKASETLGPIKVSQT